MKPPRVVWVSWYPPMTYGNALVVAFLPKSRPAWAIRYVLSPLPVKPRKKARHGK